MRTLRNHTGAGYTREQFDAIVFQTGYAYMINDCVKLDGEFTAEALRAILYAMNNKPEWIRLDDLS